jgi:opacity protein-like surface antigen
MSKVVLLISVAVLGATLAVSAQAEPSGMESTRAVSFGLGGGVSVPVSDAKDAFNNGFSGQGFVRFNLKGLQFAPRLDFTFSRFDVSSAQLATPGASGTSQIFAGLANLQMMFNVGPVRPYIIAGVGAYNLKTDVTGVPNTSSTSDTRFGVNGGGGVLFKLGRAVSAYVEGRIDNVYTDTGGFINTSQVQVVPVTFGVVF